MRNLSGEQGKNDPTNDIITSVDEAFNQRFVSLANKLEHDNCSSKEIERKVIGYTRSCGLHRRKSLAAIAHMKKQRRASGSRRLFAAVPSEQATSDALAHSYCPFSEVGGSDIVHQRRPASLPTASSVDYEQIDQLYEPTSAAARHDEEVSTSEVARRRPLSDVTQLPHIELQAIAARRSLQLTSL